MYYPKPRSTVQHSLRESNTCPAYLRGRPPSRVLWGVLVVGAHLRHQLDSREIQGVALRTVGRFRGPRLPVIRECGEYLLSESCPTPKIPESQSVNLLELKKK